MAQQNGTVSVNIDQLLRFNQSMIASRAAWSANMGKAFGGERDYYQTLGYNRTPTINDYWDRYRREHIARRIVEAYPTETWRLHPRVYEDETEIDTPFEQAWGELERRLRLFHNFYRADVLACLGRFSILLLGFNDVRDIRQMKQPVRKSVGLTINHIAPYSESHVTVAEFDEDFSSPRFGMPKYYEIDFSRGNELTGSTKRNMGTVSKQEVHYERVIHIAQDTDENEVYGKPKLEAVFNLLDDLYKVVGGSGESYWMNAKRVLIAQADGDANFPPDALAEMRENMEEYVHDLRRVLAVKGVEFKTLPAEVPSPRDAFDVIIELIAGTTRIPQRKLLGSERGELASSQDETEMVQQVMARQVEFDEPVIVRPTIGRFIEFGILPEPKEGIDGYTIEWQPLLTPSELDKANAAKVKAETISTMTGGQPLAYFSLGELRVELLEWDEESPYEMPEIIDARESEDDDDLPEEDEDPEEEEDDDGDPVA